MTPSHNCITKLFYILTSTRKGKTIQVLNLSEAGYGKGATCMRTADVAVAAGYNIDNIYCC